MSFGDEDQGGKVQFSSHHTKGTNYQLDSLLDIERIDDPRPN
jgi:hypothetical protein